MTRYLRGVLRTALAPYLVLCLAMIAPPVAAQDVYKLRAGDTIRLEVLEDPSLNRALLVAPDGRVSVPLAGTIRVSGLDVDQVGAALTQRLAPNFATPPTVFVALQAQRPVQLRGAPLPEATIDIFVVGEAARPGKLEVATDTVVLQLFAQMGGFTNFAAQKRIQLRRGEQTFTLDYKAIEAGTSNAGLFQLQDGDVLVIPQRRLFE